MRTLRLLSKSPKRSRDFFVLDTETGVVHKDKSISYSLGARPEKLLFGVIYGRDFCKVIGSAAEFKQELLKRRYKNKIVYAHNAEYDLTAIYGDIYKMDNDAIFNGKFISATNGNCTFADSYNLLQTSVETLGQMQGIPKDKLGNNLKSHITRIHEDVKYCVRDCEIVFKALTEIFTGCSPSLTIGSLSLQIFRREFLTAPIKISKLSDEFFRCYYGGRTEAFYIGKCDASVFDINSAYPYAMINCKFPNPLTLRRETQFVNLIVASKQYEGMVTARVRYRETTIPALPYRLDHKLIFPVGEFSGCWTLNEFRYALELGDIEVIEYGYAIYSEAIESPFIDFINNFYSLRNKTKNEFRRYYYKLFMNNLYGKLVQRIKHSYVYVPPGVSEKATMKRLKIKQAEQVETACNDGVFLKYEIEEKKFTSHTIACMGAYITAYVRIMLHGLMSENPDKILYCDTDSVFVDKHYMFRKSHFGDALGKWKKEEYTITRIRGLKDYEWVSSKKSGRKLKGVKKSAVEGKEQNDEFIFQRMIKTREHYRRKDGTPAGTFIEHKKVIKGNYTKRNVFRDGRTKPIKL